MKCQVRQIALTVIWNSGADLPGRFGKEATCSAAGGGDLCRCRSVPNDLRDVRESRATSGAICACPISAPLVIKVRAAGDSDFRNTGGDFDRQPALRNRRALDVTFRRAV